MGLSRLMDDDYVVFSFFYPSLFVCDDDVVVVNAVMLFPSLLARINFDYDLDSLIGAHVVFVYYFASS